MGMYLTTLLAPSVNNAIGLCFRLVGPFGGYTIAIDVAEAKNDRCNMNTDNTLTSVCYAVHDSFVCVTATHVVIAKQCPKLWLCVGCQSGKFRTQNHGESGKLSSVRPD